MRRIETNLTNQSLAPIHEGAAFCFSYFPVPVQIRGHLCSKSKCGALTLFGEVVEPRNRNRRASRSRWCENLWIRNAPGPTFDFGFPHHIPICRLVTLGEPIRAQNRCKEKRNLPRWIERIVEVPLGQTHLFVDRVVVDSRWKKRCWGISDPVVRPT